MTRIYVAGNSDDRLTIVRPIIDRLRAHSYIVTHDWTRCEGYDRKSTENERRCWAMQDLMGVESADEVWVVLSESKSEGASVEMGAALALHKTLTVSGPHARINRIFCLLADWPFDTHEEALASFLSRPRQMTYEESRR